MIIDELIKQKKLKIEEHEKRFPNDEATLEMFTKKYEGSYYINYNIGSIQPFINQIYLPIKDFIDTNHFDIKKLPKIDDPIYTEIENFPEYDYLNSVAYEMLIRNVRYKELVNNSSQYSDDELREKFDQLGLDIKDVFDLKKIAKYYSSEEEKNTFSNSYFKMTIKDINQGLDRLIQFYMDKEQIYIIDTIDKIVLNRNDLKNRKEIITGRTFKTIPDIKFEKIKRSLSNYYIPAKFDYQTPTYKDKLAIIDNNIPLVALNPDFLLSIEELLPNRIKGNIEFNFTRPLLRFKELPIIDIPINLNLSKEELTQLVIKLKDDFEAGSVKNPINLLYDRKYSFKEIKHVVPFKMTKRSMAEAFFIYDLYLFIHSAMSLHKQKLSELKQRDIEKIEIEIESRREESEKKNIKTIESLKNIHKGNKVSIKKSTEENKRDLRVLKRKLEKEKKEWIKKINKLYKEFSKEYHSMTILEDLVQNHYISPYMCKQYLKFMRKYVEELGYKELIIGYKI